VVSGACPVEDGFSSGGFSPSGFWVAHENANTKTHAPNAQRVKREMKKEKRPERLIFRFFSAALKQFAQCMTHPLFVLFIESLFQN
jgi:hypothetical protein